MIDVDGVKKDICIKEKVVKELSDWNENANILLFDTRFIRSLMVACIGIGKLKRREFHQNALEFIRGK